MRRGNSGAKRYWETVAGVCRQVKIFAYASNEGLVHKEALFSIVDSLVDETVKGI